MNVLEDPFIKKLIKQLKQPNVIGIGLSGSYARAENNQFSDVDVDIFVEALPQEDSYTLQLIDGKLVSLKYICLADEFDSLTKPESAVWSVSGLTQMQILVDETGQLARLKQSAFDFHWEGVQEKADEFAVESLMGCAEETHKVISGLLQENESKVLYASWGLFKNLSFAAAVQAGLMIESENKIFSMMQHHFSHQPDWVRAFRLSFGMDVEENIPAWQTRGRASLDLYEQTAILFEKIINNKHQEVIDNTLQLISSYKNGEYR